MQQCLNVPNFLLMLQCKIKLTFQSQKNEFESGPRVVKKGATHHMLPSEPSARVDCSVVILHNQFD